VLCSPVFRSSVLSSIPPRECGRDTAAFRDVACGMLTAELVRRIGGPVLVGGRGSQGRALPAGSVRAGAHSAPGSRRSPHWGRSGFLSDGRSGSVPDAETFRGKRRSHHA
jgi:hypothetical protein